MKKIILIILALLLLVPAANAQAAAKKVKSAKIAVKKTRLLTANQLSGLILIEKQSYNRPWYVTPKNGRPYYLKNSGMAYDVLKSLGVKIPNSILMRAERVIV